MRPFRWILAAALCGAAGWFTPAAAQEHPGPDPAPAKPATDPAPEAAPAASDTVPPAASGPAEAVESAEIWRQRKPIGYDEWRPIKREEWDLRLANALVNFRARCGETDWKPEESAEVVDALERAIRWGVTPDLALTFAQRCVQWRFLAHDAKRILWTLTQAVRSDGKCANVHDLLDETFQSTYRGDDLVHALFFEVRKRRVFEEGLIPQEERRKRERKEAEDRARKESELRAAELRGKSDTEKKEEARKR